MITLALPEDMEVLEPVYIVPYVPSHIKVIREALKLAEIHKGDVFVDLGAGDGRVVVEAAKLGAVAVGIELRDELLKKARKRIRKEGLDGKAKVVRGDLFRFEWISNATAIYMFLDPEGVSKVKDLLDRLLKPGTRVISISYPIPGWKPDKIKKVKTFFETRTVYIYIRKGEPQEPVEKKELKGNRLKEEINAEEKVKLDESRIRDSLTKIAERYDISLKPSMTLREELEALKFSGKVPKELLEELENAILKFEKKIYKET